MWRLRLRRRRSGQTDAPISDPSAVLASRAYVTLKVSTPPAGRGAQHVFEAHLRQPCAAAPHNSGHDVASSRDQEAWLAQRSDRSTAEVGGSSPPRPISTSGRWSLRQTPEVPHKVQPVEDCLVLVPRVRPPIAIEPIRVPRKSELDEFFYRNGCSWLASIQPSRNVRLRPEEIHRCSSE